jgi:lysophospholipase L1-like esterase
MVPRLRASSSRHHVAACLAIVLGLAGCGGSPTAPSALGASAGGTQGASSGTRPSDSATSTGTPLGATSFLAFGDSITCGISSLPLLLEPLLATLNCPQVGGYPELLLTRLQNTVPSVQRPLLRVLKRGQPAETAGGQGEQRLREELGELMALPAGQRPEVLLLLMGANDMVGGGVSATRTASSVAYLADVARAYNLSVLVSSMPQTFPGLSTSGFYRDNANTRIVPFNAELARLVSAMPNVWMVDMYDGFGGARAQELGYIGVDGLHPTDRGYQRMAEVFQTDIVRRFPIRGSLQ